MPLTTLSCFIGTPPFREWIGKLCPFGDIHSRFSRHQTGIEACADGGFIHAGADEHDFLATVAIDVVPVRP